MNTEYFTVPEVAQYLRISQSKVYEMVNTRELESKRHGRAIRISQEHLQEYERGDNKPKRRVRPF